MDEAERKRIIDNANNKIEGLTPCWKATPEQEARFKEYVKKWAQCGIDPPTRLITKEEYYEVMRYVQDDIEYEESFLCESGDDDVD